MKSTAMFVAYLHCRPDGTPFYVGKGSLERARSLSRPHNAHYQNVVAKHGKGNILSGHLECADEETALALEVGLIKRLRMMGVSLTNLTDGGSGTSGAVRSEEAKRRYSESKRGNQWNRGRKYPKRTGIAKARTMGCNGVIGRNGDVVMYFATIAEAARFVGAYPANISHHLARRGVKKAHGIRGWIFERAP